AHGRCGGRGAARGLVVRDRHRLAAPASARTHGVRMNAGARTGARGGPAPSGTRGGPDGPRPARLRQLALGLVFLQLALTFDNLWPTPAIVPRLALSLESLALSLVLVLAAQYAPAARKRIVTLVALAATALACGRYVEVTIPAF